MTITITFIKVLSVMLHMMCWLTSSLVIPVALIHDIILRYVSSWININVFKRNDTHDVLTNILGGDTCGSDTWYYITLCFILD